MKIKEIDNEKVVEIVSQGYDAAAEQFLKQCNETRLSLPIYHQFKEIIKQLAKIYKGRDAKILDIGCGNGVPVAQDLLQENFPYLGIDSSKEQIKYAKDLNPNDKQKFILAEMSSFLANDDRPSLLAALVLFADFHICEHMQISLYKSLYDALVPGGVILCTAMECEWEGYEDQWLGSSGTIFYCAHGQDWYKRELKSIGFEETTSFVHEQMFGGKMEKQVFMLFQKPN